MSERVLGWLFHQVQKIWVPWLLLAGVCLPFVQSIRLARWVYDDQPITQAIWVGLLLGWLLSRTKFPGWAAGVYSFLLSWGFAGQSLGKVWPDGAFSGYWEWARQANIHIFQFIARLTEWTQAVFQGRTLDDQGFFVLLMILAGWNATVWLVWWMERRKQALPGVLVYSLLLALNIYLSQQTVFYMVWFGFCAVLMVARTASTHVHLDWDRRKVDYPEDLALEWSASAVSVALLVCLVALLAAQFANPVGWGEVSDWVKSWRKQAAETTERLFPGVNPPSLPAVGLLVETPNLSQIGRPLPRSQDTVMLVTISDPPPPPAEAGISAPGKTHYWRSEIYQTYTGRGWEPAALSDGSFMAEPLPDPPLGRYLLHQQVQMIAEHAEALFSVNNPVWTATDGVTAQTTAEGSLLLRGAPEQYELLSWVSDFRAEQLQDAGELYPPEIITAYLQLTPDLPERVRSLARRVAGDAEAPYDKAVLVQEYLRGMYVYSLDAPLTPEGRDVVDVFLFSDTGGFCTHFASAMVVMLRSLGVPSRVVTGYAMGWYDAELGAYRVPASAAHAWVEVYFPGLGWVEFEPTAAVGTINYPAEQEAVGAVPVTASAKPASSFRWLLLLLVLLAAGLVWMGWLLLRNGFLSGGAPKGKAQGLYRQVRRGLGWVGMSSSSSTTPAEFLVQWEADLGSSPHLNRALHQATRLFESAEFTQRLPAESEVLEARRLWRISWWEWVKLGVKRLVKRRIRKAQRK